MHTKSTDIGSFTESIFGKLQRTMPRNINWELFSHILSTSFFFISLAIPLLILNVNGISQIGFNEESIGYRYFHSLRLLYGDHEFPWLPQGQLIGLMHMLVQLLITKLGFPINDHYTRIELFINLSLLITYLIAAITFFFCFRSINSFISRIFAAAMILVAAFAPSPSGMYLANYMYIPDYLSWVLIPTCVLIYASFRYFRDNVKPETLDYVLLGLFSGACATLKVTYLIFPFTISMMILHKESKLHVFIFKSLYSVIIGLATLFTILLFYYQFSLHTVIAFLNHLYEFLGSASDTSAAWEWLSHGIFVWPIQFITISMFLPFALFTAIFIKNIRPLSVILCLGAVLETFIGWTRFGTTCMETNLFAAGAIIIFATMYFLPQYRNFLHRFRNYLYTRANPVFSMQLAKPNSIFDLLIPALFTALLVIISYSEINSMIAEVYYPIKLTAESGRRLDAYRESISGKTLFITPNNTLRPLSLDSAVYKGGTDISDYDWGNSPLMHKIFPDRWYLHGFQGIDAINSINIDDFKILVFTYFPDTKDADFNRIIEQYRINLSSFTCDFEAPTGNGSFLVGCKRNGTVS